MIAALSGPQATVHSFEPVDQIHARLSVNVRSNGVQNVRLHQAGVSTAAGWAAVAYVRASVWSPCTQAIWARRA
ncbi:hypothetical protein [Streptomyces canus]|uniref:hypothetical protein n=1 Tax=Streptomyces canus TaxID=58343 RepID=UPI0038674543